MDLEDKYKELFPGQPTLNFAHEQVEYGDDIEERRGPEWERYETVPMDRLVGVSSVYDEYFKSGEPPLPGAIETRTWLELLNRISTNDKKYNAKTVQLIDDDVINCENQANQVADYCRVHYLVAENKYFISNGIHRLTYLKFRGAKAFKCRRVIYVDHRSTIASSQSPNTI